MQKPPLVCALRRGWRRAEVSACWAVIRPPPELRLLLLFETMFIVTAQKPTVRGVSVSGQSPWLPAGGGFRPQAGSSPTNPYWLVGTAGLCWPSAPGSGALTQGPGSPPPPPLGPRWPRQPRTPPSASSSPCSGLAGWLARCAANYSLRHSPQAAAMPLPLSLCPAEERLSQRVIPTSDERN